MNFYHIAVKNFRRRKTNMIFLVSGMIVGITTVITLFLLTQAMENSLSEDFDAMGSRLLILPSTEQVSFTFEGVTLAESVAYDIHFLSFDILDKIKNSHISDKLLAVSPRYFNKIMVNGVDLTVVGIDFEEEIILKPYWKIEGYFPEGSNQILLGNWAAERLSLATGQKIDIQNETFTITGILKELGEQDDDRGFVTLVQASKFEGEMGGLGFIEISVKTEGDTGILDKVVKQLNQEIPETRITSVKEAIDIRRKMIEQFKHFSILISGLMLITASLSVATSMQSSINERTKELGILRAIGFRKNHIIKIMVIEVNILSAIGGLAGYLIGTGTAFLISQFINDFKLTISLDPLLALYSISLAAAVGTASSTYPAIRAASMSPADSLRQI